MKKMTIHKMHPPQFIRSRWFIFSAIGVVLLAGLGVYGWWSKTSWDTYENRYAHIQEDIDGKLEATFSLRADTQQERQEKLLAVAAVSKELASVDASLCSKNALLEWQRVIKQYAERDEACHKVRTLLSSFNTQLETSVEYLQNEQALSKRIASFPSMGEVAEADFDGQLAAWRSASQSVKDASSSGRFDSVKQAATETTDGIVKAWEEVIGAHQAKDKTRYIKATQDLAAAYDKLGNIAILSSEQMTSLAADLKGAYQDL